MLHFSELRPANLRLKWFPVVIRPERRGKGACDVREDVLRDQPVWILSRSALVEDKRDGGGGEYFSRTERALKREQVRVVHCIDAGLPLVPFADDTNFRAAQHAGNFTEDADAIPSRGILEQDGDIIAAAGEEYLSRIFAIAAEGQQINRLGGCNRFACNGELTEHRRLRGIVADGKELPYSRRASGENVMHRDIDSVIVRREAQIQMMCPGGIGGLLRVCHCELRRCRGISTAVHAEPELATVTV